MPQNRLNRCMERDPYINDFTACSIKGCISQFIQQSACWTPEGAKQVSQCLHLWLWSCPERFTTWMCVHEVCLPSFIASGFSCFPFQSCERMESSALDGSDIVSQPSNAVFSRFHGIIFEGNRPIISQRESHDMWLDLTDGKLDLAYKQQFSWKWLKRCAISQLHRYYERDVRQLSVGYGQSIACGSKLPKPGPGGHCRTAGNGNSQFSSCIKLNSAQLQFRQPGSDRHSQTFLQDRSRESRFSPLARVTSLMLSQSTDMR